MKKTRERQIQIPQELFILLLRYFLFDDKSEDTTEAILKRLNGKIDSIIKHDTYTTYKTAETETEREKARKEYLEMVGMHKDFRW